MVPDVCMIFIIDIKKLIYEFKFALWPLNQHDLDCRDPRSVIGSIPASPPPNRHPYSQCKVSIWLYAQYTHTCISLVV